jgi:hypothetical protein
VKLSKTKQYPALFATNTVDGPRDAAHLVALLHACGMSAAAWMVDEMRAQIDGHAEELSDAEAEHDNALAEERNDVEREIREELEPFREAFEEIGVAWRVANEERPYAPDPADEGDRKLIIEDLRLAAETRAKEEAAKEAREAIRKASAQRRAVKAAK